LLNDILGFSVQRAAFYRCLPQTPIDRGLRHPALLLYWGPRRRGGITNGDVARLSLVRRIRQEDDRGFLVRFVSGQDHDLLDGLGPDPMPFYDFRDLAHPNDLTRFFKLSQDSGRLGLAYYVGGIDQSVDVTPRRI
jgi:hypothetical protein